MIDNATALERIEAAERQTPFCACGEPTVPVAHHGQIWLRCTRLNRGRSRLRKLLTLDPDVAHTERPILSLTDVRLAA